MMKNLLDQFSRQFSKVSYKQGQYNQKDAKIREYFYYVDHNGMLFLDDSRMKNFTSAFKDQIFLTFFFRNLKINKHKEYLEEFPYVSLCGVERNYTRCDDLPIVFTKLIDSELYYGFSDKLKVNFTPENLEVKNGRIYHPTFMKEPRTAKGLIRSLIVDELSDKIFYDKNNSPIGIHWDGKEVLFTVKQNGSGVI